MDSGQGEGRQAIALADMPGYERPLAAPSGDLHDHLVAQHGIMETDRAGSSKVSNGKVHGEGSVLLSEMAQLPASTLAATPVSDRALVNEDELSIAGKSPIVLSEQHRAGENREGSGKVTGNATFGPSKAVGNDNTGENQRSLSISWAEDIRAGSSESFPGGNNTSGAAESGQGTSVSCTEGAAGEQMLSVPGETPDVEVSRRVEIDDEAVTINSAAAGANGVGGNIDGGRASPVVEAETSTCSGGTSQMGDKMCRASDQARRRTSVPWVEDTAGGQTPASEMLTTTTSGQFDAREEGKATIPEGKRTESGEARSRTSVPWAEGMAGVDVGSAQRASDLLPGNENDEALHPSEAAEGLPGSGSETQHRASVPWVEGIAGEQVSNARTSPESTSGTKNADAECPATTLVEIRQGSGEPNHRTSVSWAEGIAGIGISGHPTSGALPGKEGDDTVNPPQDAEGPRGGPEEMRRQSSVPWVKDIADIPTSTARTPPESTLGTLIVDVDDRATASAEKQRPSGETSISWAEGLAGTDVSGHPASGTLSGKQHNETIDASEPGEEHRTSSTEVHRSTYAGEKDKTATPAERYPESGESRRHASVPWVEDITDPDVVSGHATSGALPGKEGDDTVNPTQDAEGRRGGGNKVHRQSSVSWVEDILGDATPDARKSSGPTPGMPSADVDDAVATVDEIHRTSSEILLHRTSVSWAEDIAGVDVSDHPTFGARHGKDDAKTTGMSNTGEGRRGSGNDEHRRTSAPRADDMEGKTTPETRTDASERSHEGADGAATTASETGTEWHRKSSHISISWAEGIASGKPASGKTTPAVSAG